jgi:hypothetical protein
MRVGWIYQHAAFYADPDTGELMPKFLVVLARVAGDDFVARLLTSRPHGRPETPRCYHGHPYSGFHLGVLEGPLGARSWVDLRHLPDLDALDAERATRRGLLTEVMPVPANLLGDLLDCVAAAPDTSKRQEQAIRDELARMR